MDVFLWIILGWIVAAILVGVGFIFGHTMGRNHQERDNG